MPRFCETLHIYSFVAHVRTASSVLRTCAPLTVSRHGAICASVLVSKLSDTPSLDYRVEVRENYLENQDFRIFPPHFTKLGV